MAKQKQKKKSPNFSPLFRAVMHTYFSAAVLSFLSVFIFALFISLKDLVPDKWSAPFQKISHSNNAFPEQLPEDPVPATIIRNYEFSPEPQEFTMAALGDLLEEEDCLKVNALIRSLLANHETNQQSFPVESRHSSKESPYPITRHSVFLNSPDALSVLAATIQSQLGSSCKVSESRLSRKRALIQIYQYDLLCAEVLCIENFEDNKTAPSEDEFEHPAQDGIPEEAPLPKQESESPPKHSVEPELKEQTNELDKPFSEQKRSVARQQEESPLIPEPREIAAKEMQESAPEQDASRESPESDQIIDEEDAETLLEELTILPPEEEVAAEEVHIIEPAKREEHAFPATPDLNAHPCARLAIILDDGGYFKEETERVLALDYPLTLAILPDTPLGQYIASEGKSRGFETILHMPMQAGNGGKNRFPGELTVSMTGEEIQQRTRECLAMYPGIFGVNNHTGGLFTTQYYAMSSFMDVLAQAGVYFVDSITTAKSCAFQVAIEKKVPCTKRDIFLDHDNTLSEVRKQFHIAVEQALLNGSCLAIGHFRKNTVFVLEEQLPLVKSKGVRIVPVSELVW
jgi:hypothetical protein